MTFQRTAHKTFYKIANAFKVDRRLPYALHRHNHLDRSRSIPHSQSTQMAAVETTCAPVIQPHV